MAAFPFSASNNVYRNCLQQFLQGTRSVPVALILRSQNGHE